MELSRRKLTYPRLHLLPGESLHPVTDAGNPKSLGSLLQKIQFDLGTVAHTIGPAKSSVMTEAISGTRATLASPWIPNPAVDSSSLPLRQLSSLF